eukprot:scaffold69309_cov65-Phaeocystis_antarctica.AAC.16
MPCPMRCAAAAAAVQPALPLPAAATEPRATAVRHWHTSYGSFWARPSRRCGLAASRATPSPCRPARLRQGHGASMPRGRCAPESACSL